MVSFDPQHVIPLLAAQLSTAWHQPLQPTDLHLHVTGPQSFQLWVLSAGQCHSYSVQYDNHFLYVDQQGQQQIFSLTVPEARPPQPLPTGDPRYAKLNGKLSQITLQVGQIVTKGTPLYVLTAMKMQMTYHAPASGTITQVFAQAGDTLNQGQMIFDWTEERFDDPISPEA